VVLDAGSVDLLQLEAEMILLPGRGTKPGTPVEKKQIEEADAHIEAFLNSNPASVPGRLFWAVWLTKTGRATEATAYLENPANFPGDKDGRYQRVLALALINAGNRSKGAEVLRRLPSSPEIDAALVRWPAARRSSRSISARR
jgi:hypothetical protein